MKVAYLILAHEHPAHLRRLTKALLAPSFSIFVHVDRKSALDDFAAGHGANVSFVEEQIPVYWGDFSQVEATLMLLRTAMADNRHFDYFVLLSGTDYPLYPASLIQRFFERNAGNEFISITRMPDDAQLISRLDHYRASPTQPTIVRGAVRLAKALGIKLKRNYRAALDPLLPYGGSTWWALSRSACAYIQRFVDEHPRVVEFFKNTRCPDESFFQTILGNSPFKPHVTSNLTYADWSGGGSSPQQISEKHVDTFKAQSLFTRDDGYRPGDVVFARKFCDGSGELVAAIDALRWETKAEGLPPELAPRLT